MKWLCPQCGEPIQRGAGPEVRCGMCGRLVAVAAYDDRQTATQQSFPMQEFVATVVVAALMLFLLWRLTWL
jgi:hypothetical protein